MISNMTKAQLMEELRIDRQRIADLERVSVPAGREALFSLVFQVSPSWMVLTEVDTGKYVEVNEAFLNTLGYRHEEVIGKTSAELNIFVDSNQRAILFERLQRQGYLRDEFVSVHTKAGEIRYGMLTGELIQVQEQKFILIGVNDITSRKQEEDELHLVESRYRALIENAPDGIALIGTDFKFKYASPSAEKIFGYDLNTDLELSPDALTHPDDLPMVLGVLSDLLEHPERTPTIQYRFLHKDGDWRWIESTFSNLLALPSVEAIVINFRDITERKLTEMALQASEENYRKLAETSDSAIAVLDREGRILYANPISLRIWQEPQLVGKTIHDLFTKEIADGYLAVVQRVIDEHLTDTNELEATIKGRSMWFHATMSPLKNSDGSVDTLLFNAMDITARKRAEVLLVEAQRIGRIGYMEWNIDKEYLTCSEELYEIFGLPLSTPMTQATIATMLASGESYRLRQLDAEAFALRSDVNYEYCIYLRDGQKLYLHQHGKFTYNEAGVPIRMMAIIQDITERKETEEALRQSEERLRLSLSATNLGMYDLNVQTGEAIVNREYALMLGYDPDTFVETNQAWLERTHPDDRDRTAQVFIDYTSGILPEYRVEFRQRTHDGQWKWILSLGKVLEYDATGKPLRMLGTHTDITDRKQSEQFLRESEERYRLLSAELEERVLQRTAEVKDLYDKAPTGYYSLNAEGCYVNINQTVLNWLGYAQEEMLGRTFKEFITSESIEVFKQNFPNFKKIGYVHDLEFEFIRKDSSTFLALVNATASYDEHGNYLASRSTVIDITQRKKTELALRESEETYRALFESANDAIFIISPESGSILSCNPRCFEVLGWLPEELIGRQSEEFIMHAEVNDADNKIQSLLNGKYIPVYERRFIGKDGNFIDTEINLSLIRDGLGQPKYIQSVVRNISARKQAENALRESEEQNRLLFEESPEAVILFDDTGRVMRVNHAFENVTGVVGDTFIGHLVTEIGLLPSDLMNALAISVEEEFLKESPYASLEFKLKHASGEMRDISTRVFTLNVHGKPQYLASMHDVTTNKHAEETLRLANAEMERSLRLKDEFLANMSHELRTPLNAILGISESLLEQISGPVNEKQTRYLQTILESAQHLLELINDILDLAKINAGRVDLDLNKTDIQMVANASLRMIRELAQKKGVGVEFEIDETVKQAWVDERRLKQMLVNLLSNAVKFTPKFGKIGLEVRADPQDGILTFTIWDTGIGIAEKDLRLLFQPFIQLDAGFSRTSQGTGLGLVLVSQMARLHGGSVSVESTPGKGSRFSILLPWIVIEENMPPISSITKESTPLPQNNDRSIILLVEDTVEVTMLISDYLESHGYAVITAKDGYEAIARVKEKQPDLILMDVMMPELDGVETTRRLRSDLDMAEVPIIALTALAMTGDRERCLEAGMNDYLSKPVRLKELLVTIEKHLHRGGLDE